MIFVDSNIPMYLIGADHQHKFDAQRILERLAVNRRRLVTSSEVFQELLRRYLYIQRPEFVQPAFGVLRGTVDEVTHVNESDVFVAKDIALSHPQLSARDAVHAAVMKRLEVTEILSFDEGFDRVPGVTRISA